MVEVEVKKKKEEKAKVWETITDLIKQGTKPTKQQMSDLFSAGQAVREQRAGEKAVVPELKPTQVAAAMAKRLQSALEEAVRHEDPRELDGWA